MDVPLVRVTKFIATAFAQIRQRALALFLTVLILFGIGSTPALALASLTGPTAADIAAQNPHKTSTTPSIGTINTAQPAAPAASISSVPAASDAVPAASSNLLRLNKPAANVANQPLTIPSLSKPVFQPHELTDKRTATTSQFLNKDGTVTQTNYFSSHFYQNNGSWDTIDTTLAQDDDASDSGNVIGQALGVVGSWFGSPNAYTVHNNSWLARFTPSDFSGGMLRVKQGNSQVGFSPVNANTVDPIVITDTDGSQLVVYSDLWNGVDVYYKVTSDQVKESIMLHNKGVASQIQFKVTGADLQKPTGSSNDKQVVPAFVVKGALGDQFAVSPANLILPHYGYIDDATSGLTQSYSNGVYTVAVSNAYLQSLPASAFPAVIDPSISSHFGSRTGGNYVSFKSDGYICYSNNCDLLAGSLYDSNNTLRYWRGAFFSPYDDLRPSGTILDSAVLHLTQLTGVSWWTGDTGTHNFQAGHATCLNSFNCVDANWGSANIATSGDINLTSLYQNRIAAGDWGAWIMVMGEDGTTNSYKTFNPDLSYVTFTYHSQLASPTFVSPTANQLYVDPQASFRLNYENNPNNSTQLQYELLVSDGSGQSGTLIDSGLQNSMSYTVADGILQDGSTYYVQARSYDPSINLHSPWSAPVPFKIDMRTGKDRTQTYDTLGPVSIDLATGNVATGTTSHATKALAGSLGVSLDYNSALKSRPGLVGTYWDTSHSLSSPNLIRVDQNVDFDWQAGSPSALIPSPNNFNSQWNGYFVAPVTGSYTFGAINDDNLAITVNNQQLYSNGGCYSGPCFGSSISLTAGQVVPFQASYSQGTGADYAHIYVTGAVSQQVVPQAWFQTGVRPLQPSNGLVGRYYSYADTGVPPTIGGSGNTLFLTRTDPLLSFNWSGGSPIPNGSQQNFLAHWSGNITVPATGSYVFGAQSDDGTKITVNGQSVYARWSDGADATPQYGTGITLNAGQSYPIAVDYYQHQGGDSMTLLVQAPGGTPQVVPSGWLTPQAQILPAGWGLGIDPDGAAYTRLTANQNNAILTDSTGYTHDYTWANGAYAPPTNEYGHLIRNLDGTFTLQDSDGKTYVFDNTGALTSLTNPVDDQHPAALQYSYGAINGSGPVTIQQITDGVNANRWAKVYYGGASQCGTPASGFGSTPANMLCALQTNDGRTTYFYYDSAGNLAEVLRPGNDATTYQYQAVLNGSVTVGYQLIGIRNTLANDAIVANIRYGDASTYSQIGYDVLGRASSVTAPAASPSATQLQDTIQYLPGTIGYVNGNPSTGYFGATQEHVTNATEPSGYSMRVEYDNLFRTTTQYDNQGLATTQQWDAAKDLLYATNTPTGLEMTTIYDDDDRPIAHYGPAPSSWFSSATNTQTTHTDITPTSGHASQVARGDVAYDQGLSGLAVNYIGVTENTANSASLTGGPLLHSTNIASDGTMSKAWSTSPIPNVSSNWGFSMTGKMRLPTFGNWTFRVASDNGVRMWIDNVLVIDDWKDNAAAVSHPTYSFYNVTANSLHDVRIDYYHLTGGASFTLYLTPPGGSETNSVASFFTPDYSLNTTATSYDSTYGNTAVTTNYGGTPELGLAQSATVDPSGLNLTASSVHEAPGTGYLRQTSQTSPGGSTTTYGYYNATDTLANPCVSGSTAAYQAGLLKNVTFPGATSGSAGKIVTYVYDDAGNVVATQTNTDGWECRAYDARERLVQEVVPAYNGSSARTITYNYDVNNNPLVTSVVDNYGTITTITDLLGRTVSYYDTFGDLTTTSYDNLGRVQSQTGPQGTTTYAYDNFNRVTDEKLGTTDLAQPTYDAYGRLSMVTYPSAGTLKETIGYDATTSAQSSVSYATSNGTNVTDGVTRTQSGKVQQDTISNGTASLNTNYTYDLGGRLTGATIGSNTYSYGFGTQNASCGTGSSTNPNSGMNGNRTTQTINGVTNTYCYNYADQLTTSTDPTVSGAQYDNHGNMTQSGSNGSLIQIKYDSSDRAWQIAQTNPSGTGDAVYYGIEALGRVAYRQHTTITNWSWNTDGTYWYGYNGNGSAPAALYNSSWQVIEKYLQLPGGVTLIIYPQNTTQASQYNYNLSNLHSDTMLTADGNGNNSSTGSGPSSTFVYDPFGSLAPGASSPSNFDQGSLGYGGSHLKLTEATLASTPIVMGARIYLPTLGRFTSVDPIPGGNANAYVYPIDPVNGSDWSGMLSVISNYGMQGAFTGAVVFLQPTMVSTNVQSLSSVHAAISHVAGRKFDPKAAALAPIKPAPTSINIVDAALQVAALAPYSVYYGVYKVRNAAVNAVPWLQYTPFNLYLLSIEGAGLGIDAGIDTLKSEPIGDEGAYGCMLPLHRQTGFCGPYIYLPGVHADGTIDW